MKGVSKHYPGTLAVDRVDLSICSGEVHAIVGENGAGKSTLMEIIAGAFSDYAGEIVLNGRPVELRTPALAKAAGIGMIHQELSLAAPSSVAENILAGRLPIRRGWLDRAAMLREARRCLAQVGLEDLDPLTPVEELPPHEAQLVEIAKVLGNRPCILVMDEPTSALSRQEVLRLFEIVRGLRRRGIAVIYISHHLSEIFEVADRVTVLRDGRKIATRAMDEVTSRDLVEMMIGGAATDLVSARATPPGDIRLRVERWTRRGFFHECSLEVRGAEILGIAGLAGAGRSELARSLCGIDPHDGGRMWLDGREIAPRDCAGAIAAGLAYLSEDRKSQGLALRLTAAENLLSAVIPRHTRWGIYRRRAGGGLLRRLVEGLRIQPPDPRREAATFSGGNQQKILLAKWLATDPEVLILDEPTRGVDVGAKRVIHRAIAEVADRGKAVILISSDLPELVGLSDRIAVMRRGQLTGEMAGPGASERSVLLAANGEGAVGPA
ncbi:MAG: sugar ABC transporter ATP-binding protein [Planctomycetes bacterium]|nr:sugar ABC transporter ATP-binding protein [Planctomycetota bacterium]